MSRSPLPRSAVDKLLAVGAQEKLDEAMPSTVDFGKYRLVREIGRGGMGIVYEAEDTALRRRVALKVIPETAGLSEVLRRRFAREAKSAARLTHPNIAAVYEATPDFIAMQYVDGVPLSEVPQYDRRLLVRLGRDAALAVQYAHECGLIHRDIKPTNLLVERSSEEGGEPRVYVMDFGLAKETKIDSSLSGTASILGTPAFMPPEQAEGRAHEVDERSDVYGLGATLYACLTGHPPFADKDVLRLLRRVSEEDPKAPRIETDLDAIVLKCLAKEPERRYQSARALATELDRWLRGEPVEARCPSVTYRVRKFLARRKAMVRAVAIAVLGAALVLLPFLLVERARRAGAERAVRFAERVRVIMSNADTFRNQQRWEDVRRQLAIGVEECDRFLAVDPIATGYYYRGRLHRARGRNADAIADLDHALELDPRLDVARFERGLALLAEHQRLADLRDLSAGGEGGDLPSAEAIADMRRRGLEDIQVVQRSPDPSAENLFSGTDVLFGAAEVARLQGHLERARATLDNLLRLDPNHVDGMRALARIAYEQGDADTGLRYSRRVQSLMVGLGFRAAGTPSTMGGSSAPRETSVPAVGERLVLPEIEACLVDFAPVMRRAPSEACAVADRGNARVAEAARLTGADRRDEAVVAWEAARQEFDESLRRAPFLAAAFNNRGVCWAELERLLLATGRTLEAIGAHRNALADYDEAVRLQPEFPAALRNRALVRMHQAGRLASFGRYQEGTLELDAAVQDLTTANAQDATDPGAMVARGRAYARRALLAPSLGRTDQALLDRNLAQQDLDAAVAADPRGALAHYHRGLFRLSLGDAAGARQDLELAVEYGGAGWGQRAECLEQLQSLRGQKG